MSDPLKRLEDRVQALEARAEADARDAGYWRSLISMWNAHPEPSAPVDEITRLIKLWKETDAMKKGQAAVAQRPANFESLSGKEQWEIDKRLGLLDWEGDKT